MIMEKLCYESKRAAKGVIICIHIDMIPLNIIGYVVFSIDISKDYWSKKMISKKFRLFFLAS